MTGDLFDVTFLLEADGRTVFGYEHGKPVEGRRRRLVPGRLLQARREDRTAGSRGPPADGDLPHAGRIVVAAVGSVLPSDSGRSPAEGPPAVAPDRFGRWTRLRFSSIGQAFAIGGLSLVGGQGKVGFDLMAPNGSRGQPRCRPIRADRATRPIRAPAQPMLIVLGLLMLVMIFLVATIWKTLSAMHRGEETRPARGRDRRPQRPSEPCGLSTPRWRARSTGARR